MDKAVKQSDKDDDAPRRKVVVGGTHVDYLNYLRANRLSQRDAVHATREEHLLGLELKEGDIVRLGWISQQAEETLRSRIR